MLYSGENKISKVYMGEKETRNVLLGNMKIWEDDNFGDGSLNLVKNGYDNKLKINGQLAWTAYGKSPNYSTGNFDGSFFEGTTGEPPSYYNGPLSRAVDLNSPAPPFYTLSGGQRSIVAGTNECSFNQTITGEKSIIIRVNAGYFTTGFYLNGLKLNVSDSYYTLKECLDSGYIKPIVVISSQARKTAYIMGNVLKIYTGEKTDISDYADVYIWFMTNVGYDITGFQVYSNQNFYAGHDGWQAVYADIGDFKMTL